MPLIVDWCSGTTEVTSQCVVPVFGAELVLSFSGEIIVDASWQLSDAKDWPQIQVSTVPDVQRYLLAPDRQVLRLKLLRQGSVYHHRVWQALLNIPVGRVMTYAELARTLHSGARAVAGACRANPYAGLIPCHRVVARSGLGGFMGQSEGDMVALKGHILDCERRMAGD